MMVCSGPHQMMFPKALASVPSLANSPHTPMAARFRTPPSPAPRKPRAKPGKAGAAPWRTARRSRTNACTFRRTRHKRLISPPKSACWSRSTPTSALRTRYWSHRFRAPSMQRCRPCALSAPMAGKRRISGPLVRVSISVTVKRGDRMETGSDGRGGRMPLAQFLEEDGWRALPPTRHCARRS